METAASIPFDRIFFSADPAYLPVASQELRQAIPDARIEHIGHDLGAIAAEGLSIAGLAEICRTMPIVFVRHLMRGIGSSPATAELDALVISSVAKWLNRPIRDAVSLQVWSTGPSPYDFRTDHLWQALATGLREHGVEVARGGAAQVASAIIHPHGLLLGLNSRENALSDWPGGHVRLAKSKDQIARSEFKLEELLREHDIGLPNGGIAIDLGASPGGWTRILRQHGFEVWAVDPGDLDPRIAADLGVHHVRTTARPFLDSSDIVADLIVNDMRMEPGLSSAVMASAAQRVRPGGLMIQTLKITPQRTLPAVRHALDNLNQNWKIAFARQLYHNRNEATVVGVRR